MVVNNPNRRAFLVHCTRLAGVAALAPRLAVSEETVACHAAPAPAPLLQAGACQVDITPSLDVPLAGIAQRLPRAEKVVLPLFARAVALDDGRMRFVFIVCELCLIDTETADRAKHLISQRTGLRPEQMLVAVAHTHMTPRVADFGHGDELLKYRTVVGDKIAEAACGALDRLAPAEMAGAVVDVPEFARTRRWIVDSEKGARNPFGRFDRVVMADGGPKRGWKPAGPANPNLSFLALRHVDGTPLALLANYSAHYGFTVPKCISSDYFGHFSNIVHDRWHRAAHDALSPIVVMTNGGSGDTATLARSEPEARQAADHLAQQVLLAASRLEYSRRVSLAARMSELELGVRRPRAERLEWARQVLGGTWSEPHHPRSKLYAEWALKLAEYPERVPVKLQAVRVGQFGIAATPCELYAATTLALAKESPLQPTFAIDLANGWSGYLPPAEQFPLGGFTTWPQRASHLEVGAERQVREELLRLLRHVAEA